MGQVHKRLTSAEQWNSVEVEFGESPICEMNYAERLRSAGGGEGMVITCIYNLNSYPI